MGHDVVAEAALVPRRHGEVGVVEMRAHLGQRRSRECRGRAPARSPRAPARAAATARCGAARPTGAASPARRSGCRAVSASDRRRSSEGEVGEGDLPVALEVDPNHLAGSDVHRACCDLIGASGHGLRLMATITSPSCKPGRAAHLGRDPEDQRARARSGCRAPPGSAGVTVTSCKLLEHGDLRGGHGGQVAGHDSARRVLVAAAHASDRPCRRPAGRASPPPSRGSCGAGGRWPGPARRPRCRPGASRRALRSHRRDDHAALALPVSHRCGARDLEADPRTAHRAGANDLVGDAQRPLDRESRSRGRPIRRCCEKIDELTPTTSPERVGQRAAGVARVDRGVGLDHVEVEPGLVAARAGCCGRWRSPRRR